MKCKMTFIEPMLGTLSGNPQLASEYIISKHPNKQALPTDEVQTLRDPEEDIEKETTYFARDENGRCHLWDYQVRGFLKAAHYSIILAEEFTKKDLKAVSLTQYMYKRTITNCIFVFPRRLIIQGAEPDGILERPMRVETMKGDRVCLGRSERMPAGAFVEFEIDCLNAKYHEWIIRWLDRGKYFGISQWRNAGYGRFSYVLQQ